MDCKKDYAKYPASKYSNGKCVLATSTLVVTMNSGFGYAIGEIPAGVHLEYFDTDKKDSALVQWMHGVPLRNESTFTIVSDRKKSDTVPPEVLIMSTLHNSGIYNTSAPQFSNDEISTFVAVFDELLSSEGSALTGIVLTDGRG